MTWIHGAHRKTAEPLIFVAVLLAHSACASGSGHVDSGGEHELPPTTGVFDYQLGGDYDLLPQAKANVAIDVVVRDSASEALPGAYSICYVNGFQTQPADEDYWLKHPALVLHNTSGLPVADPQWPDEMILDPSTQSQRDGILAYLGPVIDGCVARGFDAVEVDNLDTWTRFSAIDASGAKSLAAAYVERAHAAGLAVAQKNSAELSRSAHDELGFDFAITEECAVWAECGAYAEVYGDHVLQIEYPDTLAIAGLAFADVCAQDGRSPLTILRDRDLVPVDAMGYVYDACEDQTSSPRSDASAPPSQ